MRKPTRFNIVARNWVYCILEIEGAENKNVNCRIFERVTLKSKWIETVTAMEWENKK